MRLTSSFAVFRFDPNEQELTKPRWLAREGKVEAAEEEYRKALGRNPDLYAGWQELFELLRQAGRVQHALELADAAERHWGDDAAMPHTLRGAALVELGRLTEGLTELQKALDLDGAFALAWHEYGYASYRAGQYGQALMALDRAFGLEPHTDTLMLRGRILRDAGRYDAAEVAFQGAAQSSDHDVPRRDAEREILATRRAAALGGKRLRDLTPRERWFVHDGGILLLAPEEEQAALADTLARAIGSFVAFVRALEWKPAAVAGAAARDQGLAEALATALGAITIGAAALDAADRPLIVTVESTGGGAWEKQVDRMERWRSGYGFALVQKPGTEDGADVVGVGADLPPGAPTAALEDALRAAPAAGSDVPAEVLALARLPLTAWRRRAEGPATR